MFNVLKFNDYTLKYFGKKFQILECHSIVKQRIHAELGFLHDFVVVYEQVTKDQMYAHSHILNIFIDKGEFFVPMNVKISKKNNDEYNYLLYISLSGILNLDDWRCQLNFLKPTFINKPFVNEYLELFFINVNQSEKYKNINKYLSFFPSKESLGSFNYAYYQKHNILNSTMTHYNRDNTKSDRVLLRIEYNNNFLSFNDLTIDFSIRKNKNNLESLITELFSRIADVNPSFLKDIYESTSITTPYQYRELLTEFENVIDMYKI